MRYKPLGISCIAVEPAADLIVDTATCHFLKSDLHHAQSIFIFCAVILTQKKTELRARRKFRRTAETAVMFIKGSLKLIKGVGKRLGGNLAAADLMHTLF